MALRIAGIILAVIVTFSLSTITLAQRAKTRRTNQSVRILKDKPTVYITFETFAERESDRAGKIDKGVYLRLHNNTRWSLVLEAQGANGKALATGKENEVGMFYGVEEEPRGFPMSVSSEFTNPPDPRESSRMCAAEAKAFVEAHKYDDCEVPRGNFCHVCSVIPLPPGKSLLFVLPRETLCGNLRAYIAYQYDWEDDWGGDEPEHRVYFYGSQLPKESGK